MGVTPPYTFPVHQYGNEEYLGIAEMTKHPRELVFKGFKIEFITTETIKIHFLSNNFSSNSLYDFLLLKSVLSSI